jgi:hypothetical protein
MAEQADYTGGSHVPASATGRAVPPLAAGPVPGNGGGPAASAGSLREQVGSLGAEARRETERMADDVREQMGVLVHRRKQLVAERIGSIASALREAALRLEHDSGAGAGEPPVAVGLDAVTRGMVELVDGAAERIDRASDYLHEREVRDLLRDLERFARRRPAAFVGGGLAAGFLLARFFKSSGERVETVQGSADLARRM